MGHSAARETNEELRNMLKAGSSRIPSKPPPKKEDNAELSSESDNAADEKEDQKWFSILESRSLFEKVPGFLYIFYTYQYLLYSSPLNLV